MKGLQDLIAQPGDVIGGESQCPVLDVAVQVDQLLQIFEGLKGSVSNSESDNDGSLRTACHGNKNL